MRSRAAPVMAAAVILGGCAMRTDYPVLPATTAQDGRYTCQDIDDEILRADALRNAILGEQANDAANAAGNAVLNGITSDAPGLIISAIRLPGLMNRRERYRQASDACDRRLQQLLVYKRDRNCPAWARADHQSAAESEILSALIETQKQLARGEITEAAAAQARRSLLNQLR